jgi:hypothetical protein
MITADTIYMPLQESWLCLDCSSIGNQARQCPACASQVVQSLAKVLDRETEPQEVSDADRD